MTASQGYQATKCKEVLETLILHFFTMYLYYVGWKMIIDRLIFNFGSDYIQVKG